MIVMEPFTRAWHKNVAICIEAYYTKDRKYPDMSPKNTPTKTANLAIIFSTPNTPETEEWKQKYKLE